MTFLLATRLASHRVACNSRCCTSLLLLLLLFFAASFLRHTRTNLINTKSSTRAETEPSPAPLCLPLLPPPSPTDHVIDALIRILTAVIAVAFAGNMPRAEPVEPAEPGRAMYSQWRIHCRDSLMLRVYGLLKGFAHCILSSLGHRLSNLITLRH